jgi:hypothetical protein
MSPAARDYAVSIVNDGDVALTDLTITDDLGGYSFAAGPSIAGLYNGLAVFS